MRADGADRGARDYLGDPPPSALGRPPAIRSRKFAHLPLAAEHPGSVSNWLVEGVFHRRIAWQWFDPEPMGDRRRGSREHEGEFAKRTIE